jgi:hypothetical protein
MNAVVTWSHKVRIVALVAVPALAWLARWSFTNVENPSDLAGGAFVAMAALAAAFAAQTLIYRLRATSAGLVEHRLWGTRRATWNDVLKVEGIAQEARDGAIYRSPAAPADAFHLIIHTRRGRFSVNRWMDGVDQLVDLLAAQPDGAAYRANPLPPLQRDDASVEPALRPSPARAAINRATDALVLVQVLVLALPLSWFVGLILSIKLGVDPTGSPLLDATLVALVPWGLGFIAYAAIKEARRRRFGDEHATPALNARAAILTMTAAIGGPLLLVGFVPRLAATFDKVELALAALGVFLCWVPIAEVRRQLARP